MESVVLGANGENCSDNIVEQGTNSVMTTIAAGKDRISGWRLM